MYKHLLIPAVLFLACGPARAGDGLLDLNQIVNFSGSTVSGALSAGSTLLLGTAGDDGLLDAVPALDPVTGGLSDTDPLGELIREIGGERGVVAGLPDLLAIGNGQTFSLPGLDALPLPGFDDSSQSLPGIETLPVPGLDALPIPISR